MTKHFRATARQTTYQTRPRAAFTTQALRAGVTGAVAIFANIEHALKPTVEVVSPLE